MINDDDMLDKDEEFHLTIVQSSLPNRVNRIAPEQAVVTIVDNISMIYH